MIWLWIFDFEWILLIIDLRIYCFSFVAFMWGIEQIILSLIAITGVILLFVLIHRTIILTMRRTRSKKLARRLRFVQVKIPLKSVSKSQDLDANDHIQNMKQNIEVMNQIYKNFYAVYDDSWRARKLWQKYMSMEIFIEKESIKFIMAIPKDYVSNLEKTIAWFYSWSNVDIIWQTKLLEAGKFMAGGEFSLKKDAVYPIKTYENFEADPMDSILSSYAKVWINEKLCLQILAQPMDENLTKKFRKKIDDIKKWAKDGLFNWVLRDFIKWVSGKEDKWDKDPNEEKNKHNFSQQQTWDLDKKLEDELFNIKIRAFATSPIKANANNLVDDLAKWFTQYNYVGLNSFKFSKMKDIQRFSKDFVWRDFFTHKSFLRNIKEINKKTILNIKEISSIFHFPHSRFNRSPRISRQKYKVVAAPDNIPQEWMLIGHNNYGGISKEIRMQHIDRFRHIYIVGQTGTGKTTLMLLQAIRDMEMGSGFCYIDPHGDAVETLLKYFPKERIDDLIYFDLSNTEYPIWLNPLQANTEDEKDIATNDLVEMFVNMFGPEVFGARIQDYFRNACFLLMDQEEGGTLVDIMRVFTDEAFAESKIRNIKNPVIAARRNKTYKKMGEREKAEIIPFLQAKFWPFTTWVYVRNVIWQPKPEFNIADAMNSKKIILCNLSKGLAGEINSQLIGRMITMQIKIAALQRAAIAEEDRVPFFLYIDEFQNYVSKSIESVLSEARKYRLWLVVAHQYIEQLKQSWMSGSIDLSTAIFGNIWTIFSLKVGAPDAEFLEKEFSPEFTQADLINMDMRKGIMKMSIDSQQSRPFSFTPMYFGTAIPELNTTEKAEIIKQISALKRWVKRELVDKEIFFRVWV